MMTRSRDSWQGAQKWCSTQLKICRMWLMRQSHPSIEVHCEVAGRQSDVSTNSQDAAGHGRAMHQGLSQVEEVRLRSQISRSDGGDWDSS